MATLPQDQVPQVAASILRYRQRELHRMNKINRYYKGHHDSVYTPRGAKTEYNWIRDRAKVNFLPLVVSVIAENLHLDGYRMSPGPMPKNIRVNVDGTPGTPGTAPPPPGQPPNAPTPGMPAPPAVAPTDPGAQALANHPGVSLDQTSVPQVPQVPAQQGTPGATVVIPTDLLFDDTTEETTSAPWKIFLANRMMSRQHGLYRSVMKYGLSYMKILPAEMFNEETAGSQPDAEQLSAVMKPVSPKRLTAFYADESDDEWPIYALEEFPMNTTKGKFRVIQLYDDTNRYTMIAEDQGRAPRWPNSDDILPYGASRVDEHGLGVCPIVRFQHEIDLDGELDVMGEVEPLMPLQDQINMTTFDLLIAEQFGAFRQRWVSGFDPTDETGRAKEPFRAGIDRLWMAEDPGTKFGEFSQTELGDYLNSIEASIRHMSTIGQVPPYHLLGLVANLSAEALAAARDGLDRKVQELQGTLDEPWKQSFQLASHAAGDDKSAKDNGAQPIWRDTSARAFAATVDALSKMSQMLGVPAPELWSRIPGVSAQDVARWKASLAQPGVLEELADLIEKAQSKGLQSTTPQQTPASGSYQQYEAREQGV
jgi:hypothetical protein